VPSLSDVVITFNTHGDNKNDSTILHVFVKNRLSTSLSPEQNSDYISNLLAFNRYQGAGDLNDEDSNPYLALAVNLAAGQSFDDPSSHTFHLNLAANDIDVDDIVLPVVNIHILTNGSDVWMFDYVIAFVFDDGQNFTYSSASSGAPGITLDQDNRNFSGRPGPAREQCHPEQGHSRTAHARRQGPRHRPGRQYRQPPGAAVRSGAGHRRQHVCGGGVPEFGFRCL
jgi:hypothetical protein